MLNRLPNALTHQIEDLKKSGDDYELLQYRTCALDGKTKSGGYELRFQDKIHSNIKHFLHFDTAGTLTGYGTVSVPEK